MPLKTPFRLVIWFITISHVVITINHNYLLRCYTFTQLTCQYSSLAIFTHSHFEISLLNACHHLRLENWTVKSKSHCYWHSVSKSWCRAPFGAHDQIFITVWQLRSCFSVAPSLTRVRVCLLYLLLALASAVFLRSESLGTRDHILLSDLRPRFSSPPTTRRVMMEVFDPVFTRVLFLMAAGSRYIASALITQRTPLPTSLLLLQPFLLRSLLSSSRCLRNHYLATVIV
jgi:hypothetical protein